MASSLQLLPFHFEGAAVRVVVVDGKPHFVGKDVTDRLGYVDATNAMKQHCRGVVKRHPIADALHRVQETRILSEPDVLRLIMGSNLPTAERFERWVFEDVLPSVRRDGVYVVGQEKVASGEIDPSEFMARAVLMANQIIVDAKIKITAQADQIAAMVPQVKALEQISTSLGSMCITDAAKTLKIQPKHLFDHLHAHGWIYRRARNGRWVAAQSKIDRGLLEHREVAILRKAGQSEIVSQVSVTAKGIVALAKRFAVMAQQVAERGRS